MDTNIIPAASSCLCPGYKLVDAFGPDDEYEEEQEELYVTLDLGTIEPTLVPSSTTYRLIGLDTPTPFLQLSGTILKGRHDTLLGTELLFTEGKDPQDRNKRSLDHVANTEQRICFREVRLQPKDLASDGKSKEDKGKDKEQALEEASHMVDRITGKSPPHARAPSGKKKTKAKGSRAKGKAKAKNAEDVQPEPDNESDLGAEDDMDIYDG